MPTKIAPQSIRVPDEFDDHDKARVEINLTESDLAQITSKLGPVPWGTTVQATRRNNNTIELRGMKEGDGLGNGIQGEPLFDGVLFDKDDLKARIACCPPPAQMVMQSKGVGLSYSGPAGVKTYHKDGDFSSEDLDDGAIEFEGSGGTITYRIPGRKCCGCLSQKPILEVLKDGELIGQMVPGPRPGCRDKEKILMRIIDKDKKELYTLRVPIEKCCKIECRYEDEPSKVAQWLGPSLKFKNHEFAEYLSVNSSYEKTSYMHDIEGKPKDHVPNFTVVGHVGTSDRTHTFWTPRAGICATQHSFGDLSTPVDEPEAIAWSLVPFQELLESSFTSDSWEEHSSNYTMKSRMYKGRRGLAAGFSHASR